eukprot:TRINITY_DN3206_c0_g2_i3.p1 TRINITY_DN3206_c0_g2~~TRINITY_DN3206_c0_g2_i3.p1  ORF type:complete len:268 (+),score=82.16 TRINITY_DN3206_c0_g2_i3:1309-2112(+)
MLFKRLCVRQNIIESLRDLPPCKQTLEELDCYENRIEHVTDEDLKGFDRLRILDLSFNGLRKIEGLENVANTLTTLYLVNNKIKQISNLDTLIHLTMLELGSNRIREIQGLEHLTQLTELWLGRNKIEEIRNLSHLVLLQRLDLQSNRIESIGSGLTTLVQLRELYLGHMGIKKIEGLETLVNLNTLDLTANQISKIEGLSTLINVEELWLGENQIANLDDLPSIATMTRLSTIYLERNPAEQVPNYKEIILSIFPNLQQLDAHLLR